MNHEEMMDRIRRGGGIIAAIDQSGGSTPFAAWPSEPELLAEPTDCPWSSIVTPVRGGIGA